MGFRQVLESVPDAYSDFVDGLESDYMDDPEGQEDIIHWITEHPDAKTEEVLAYIAGIELDWELDEENDDEDEETEV